MFDWKTAVLLLPSTYLKQRDFLKKIGILPYYYTSFYSDWVRYSVMKIGILPYYYFLLLKPQRHHDVGDWTTAVLLLPFTTTTEVACTLDWKTAVFILPST